MGPEQILSFVAPEDGNYLFAAEVTAYGGPSDDLDLHVLDAADSCRYGTCLGTGNADFLSPTSTSTWLEAGQELHVVLDGRETASTTITAEVEVFCPGSCPDADLDGFEAASCGGDDCNDADPLTRPDAVESCDGIDRDCNPFNEPFETFYVDNDGDGYGDESAGAVVTCSAPTGYSDQADDCDDDDPDAYPESPVASCLGDAFCEIGGGASGCVAADWNDPTARPDPWDFFPTFPCDGPSDWATYGPTGDITVLLEIAIVTANPARLSSAETDMLDQVAFANAVFDEAGVEFVVAETHALPASVGALADLAQLCVGSATCACTSFDPDDDFEAVAAAVPWTPNRLRVLAVDSICMPGTGIVNGVAVLDRFQPQTSALAGDEFLAVDIDKIGLEYKEQLLAHELGHLFGGLQHTHDVREVVEDTCADRLPGSVSCPALSPNPRYSCEDGFGPRATTNDPAGCYADESSYVLPTRNVMSYGRLWTSSLFTLGCNEGDYLSPQQEDMAACHAATRWAVYQPSLPLAGPASEDCDNGIDDDGDSYIDCHDFDCGDWCSLYEYSGMPYCWNDPSVFSAGDTVGQPCCGMTPGGGVEYRLGISSSSALIAPTAIWWTTANEYGCTPWTWTSPTSWSPGVYFLTAQDQTTGAWAQTTTYEVQ